MPTFGEVLKAAREAAKLTQQQLAVKAGLSQAAISKAELAPTADDAGRKETLDKIAVAVGTTLEAIVRDMNPPRQAKPAARAPTPADVDREAAVESSELGAASGTAPTRRESFEERARRIRDQMVSDGWWDTNQYDNNGVMNYLGDVIGRNFDHKRHKIVDSHELLGLFDEYLSGSSAYLTLPDHFSQEIDIGVRVMLDAMAMIRSNQRLRNFPNLAIAMAICAGREVRRALKDPAAYPVPPIVLDTSNEEIPF